MSTMPTPETVTRALDQIAKSAANYQYFFQKLNSPRWLQPLAVKGRFKTPPAKQPVEGGVTFPGWPESQYLARMAKLPEAQQQVLQIVLAMADTDNIRVHADLMEIALAVPAAEAAKLVKRARTWVQTPFHNVAMASFKIGDLIAHLATGGQANAALQLAKDAFRLLPAAPAEDSDDVWAPSPEPRAWLADWHYEEALKKAIPPLVDAVGLRTLALLCEVLDQAVSLSRRTTDTEGEDYSYIWHAAIEQDEYPPRLRNTLVATVRDAGARMIDAAPGNLGPVLQELRRHTWPVFRRIELYLLERFVTLAPEEIPWHVQALALLEGPTHHEAARLLKTSFGRLPGATQEEILQMMNAGPEEVGVRRWFEIIGQEATPEAIAQFGLMWRAQRLALIADQVPPAWQDRVNEVLARVGSVRQLDRVERGAMWTGPTSPKTLEELGQLGPDGVVAFLRAWQPTAGERESTPEGLGRVLERLIATDPAPYVERAEQFQALDPTFARFFFSGIETAVKGEKAFAWEPVLSLAAWVVAQPREIPGRKKALMEADESWQWTRGAIATLLEYGLHGPREKQVQPEIAFGARERVWVALESLTTDPDPTPEHDAKYGGDNMDPPALAINSVRGKAFNAVVAYALWVRRHLDRLDPRPPSSFDAMPEVRGVLDSHLDVQREPSLAIRSCYGRHFPWLQFLDRAWAQEAVPRIFPTDEQYLSYRHVAWDAYLLFCPAYDDVLALLESEYGRAVRELPTPEPKKKQAHTARQHLAEHLMAYYWRGKLDIDSPLLTEFFRLAADDLRGHAIDAVGRWLASRPESTGTIEDDVLTRLRTLWEWRLRVAQDSEDVKLYQDELSRFGWWFASGKFDEAWSLGQLRTVLERVKSVKPEFKVAETLEVIAPRFPLECVQCARLVAQFDREGWEVYGNEKHFKAIITAAITSGNVDAKAAADGLVQYMVGRGNFDYRALLPGS
jgi:hypothetical protein